MGKDNWSDDYRLMKTDLPIDRHEPVAKRVRDLIRTRINAGEYSLNGRMPSEAQLCVSLGVSRATVRTALEALASEGLITRRQGDGTYVNRRAIGVMTRFEANWEFTSLIEGSGRKALIEILCEERRPASPKEASLLEVPKLEEVLVIRRVFKADGLPVIYTSDVLPTAVLTVPYPPEALSQPLLNFLEAYCGQHHLFNIADVSAALADREVAEVLDLPRGAPILRLDEVIYSSDDRPLLCAVNFYNEKALRLRLVRART